ncbi:MAG TPA: phosphatidylglycerophosphatase A [Terriglobales bacterium]|nr:phosphatidylglycerophosphatase A [Terriglobales bacterium]
MKTSEGGQDASATPGETAALEPSDRSAGVPPAVAGASRPRAPLWATLVATFFGIGNLRPGPGTWGSAATVVLWWLLARWIAPAAQPEVAALIALVAVLLGIPAATRVARACGRKDPQFVVIDEVAGQLITLIAAPIAWQSLLLGFILFRAFDIVKPPPVRQLERLPEGVGIVVDDVAAGLYALAVMQVVLHFGLLPR